MEYAVSELLVVVVSIPVNVILFVDQEHVYTHNYGRRLYRVVDVQVAFVGPSRLRLSFHSRNILKSLSDAQESK